jgi:hypothetical protein
MVKRRSSMGQIAKASSSNTTATRRHTGSLNRQFVMTAPKVLHERMPGDHDPGTAILLEPPIGRSRAFSLPWSASMRLLAY